MIPAVRDGAALRARRPRRRRRRAARRPAACGRVRDRAYPTATWSGQRRTRDLSLAVHLRDAHGLLVHEAPGPVLARLERPHDRVPLRPGVLGGVPLGRAVAAAHAAALEADAQMEPLRALRKAVLAAVDRLRQLG